MAEGHIRCELCMDDEAVTKVEYQDLMYNVCSRCKSLADSEGN